MLFFWESLWAGCGQIVSGGIIGLWDCEGDAWFVVDVKFGGWDGDGDGDGMGVT